MKCMIKDKKVLQAITIGLAAAITATSMPVSVYADDENISTINTENSNENNENTNTQSEENLISEVAGNCADIINENGQSSEVIEAINEASDAIGEIVSTAAEQEIEVPIETLSNIQNELQTSANEIVQANENLEIAVQDFNEVLVADLNIDNTLQNCDTNINTIENKVNEFNTLNSNTTNTANETISQAEIANTSNLREEAYAARDKAIDELNKTENNLKIAEDAYKVAKDAADSANEKYQEALIEQQKIENKLKDAKDKLKNANQNATAANEQLKAIQSQMDAMNKEVADLAQSKEDLQALEEQYHKLLVHYYRDPAINSAVYDENGKLLSKDSADKAVTDGKVDNHPSLSENTLKIGRELMKDLVMYKLKANGAEDIQFAVQEKGLTKKQSADGELTTDNKGNEKVNIGETQDQYWTYPSGDDGRHHRVKVTYTITTEEGKKEVTEYYNYIIKAGKYNDNTDMSNGPIYLAQIDNETGEVIRDTDKNNMDDYIKLEEELNKAIDAAKLIDEYNNAKQAVDDAQSLVDSLNTTIKTLSEKDLKINEQKVKDLKEKLDNAKEILELATKDKETLEDKVEEARKAVEGIDLSRFIEPETPFIVEDEESDEDDEDSDTSEDTSSAEDAPAAVTSDTIESIPYLVGSETTSGTSTTISGGGNTENTSAGVAGAKVDKPEDTNKDKPKLVKIEDNEIPLSAMPILEQDHSLLWWIGLGWLLLLIAYIIYKLSKKKEEKEEANKKEQ